MKKSSLKVGDKVSWTCRPASPAKPFVCTGSIAALVKKTVKSIVVQYAKLDVSTLKYKKTFGRKSTTIKVSKLTTVEV